MENIFELSYAGTVKGLMDYIKSNTPNCEICNDDGFLEIIKWVGTDDSYQETVRCQCNRD